MCSSPLLGGCLPQRPAVRQHHGSCRPNSSSSSSCRRCCCCRQQCSSCGAVTAAHGPRVGRHCSSSCYSRWGWCSGCGAHRGNSSSAAAAPRAPQDEQQQQQHRARYSRILCGCRYCSCRRCCCCWACSAQRQLHQQRRPRTRSLYRLAAFRSDGLLRYCTGRQQPNAFSSLPASQDARVGFSDLAKPQGPQPGQHAATRRQLSAARHESKAQGAIP